MPRYKERKKKSKASEHRHRQGPGRHAPEQRRRRHEEGHRRRHQTHPLEEDTGTPAYAGLGTALAATLELQRTAGNRATSDRLTSRRRIHPLAEETDAPAYAGLGTALAAALELQASTGNNATGDRLPSRRRHGRPRRRREKQAPSSFDPGVEERLTSPGPEVKDVSSPKTWEGVPSYWRDPGIHWTENTTAGGWEADVPKGHTIWNEIETFIQTGLAKNEYRSEKQENTRMLVAGEIAANNNGKYDDEQIAAAQRRLREGEPGGAPLVKSGPITITRIKMIANQNMWADYLSRAQEVQSQLDPGHFDKVKFAVAQPELPNRLEGEAHLLHVTNSEVMDIIQKKNFDPSFVRVDKGKAGKPRFGQLGQGSYFGDTMSKAMTYSQCPQCKDYGSDCECQTPDGEPPAREVMLARTLLGHPKKRAAFAQFWRSGELRTHAYDMSLDKAASCGEAPKQRHSVYSRGWDLGRNPLKAGSGSNEFLVKRRDQIYPEFRIFWRHARRGASQPDASESEDSGRLM